MDKKVLSDAEKAMLVQKHQADKAKDSLVNNNMLLDKLEEESKEKHRKILEMKKETEKLMNNAGIDKSALENVVIDSKKSDRLRRMREARANIKTEQIIQEHNINLVELINDVDDWDSYIQRVYEYADKYDVDLETDPYQQLLTPEEYKSIIDEYHLKFGKVEWCAADYAVVGLSVLTAVLTDYFLVAVPPVNTVNGVKNQIYQGVEQKGSPITKFLLEQKNKVMNAKHGDNKILKGMYAKVNLEQGEVSGIFVPTKAVMIKDLYSYIAIVREGKATIYRVTPKETIGDMQLIEFEDYKAGDRVVVEGQYLLNNNDKVKEN